VITSNYLIAITVEFFGICGLVYEFYRHSVYDQTLLSLPFYIRKMLSSAFWALFAPVPLFDTLVLGRNNQWAYCFYRMACILACPG